MRQAFIASTRLSLVLYLPLWGIVFIVASANISSDHAELTLQNNSANLRSLKNKHGVYIYMVRIIYLLILFRSSGRPNIGTCFHQTHSFEFIMVFFPVITVRISLYGIIILIR